MHGRKDGDGARAARRHLDLIRSTALILVASIGASVAAVGTTERAAAGWLPVERIAEWATEAIARGADTAEGETNTAQSEANAAKAEAKPKAKTIRLKPRPKPGPFRMNLYSQGDFVHQQTTYWCVAASVQTMMNIIDDGKPRQSRAFQKRLHFQGRNLDREEDEFWRQVAGPYRWERGLHGLGLEEWRDLLTTNGYGRYKVDRARTLNKAIRMAAKAIRQTGRPAGLVVWRGAHAWVMSGFNATADPAFTNDFKVRSVFIQDPWYPYVSTIWGASRPPNAKVSMAALGEDFLRYNRPGRKHPMRDGKYMLILPVLPADTRVR